MFAKLPAILTALKNKELIILVDDEGRENEGDLVFAADFVSNKTINFMITYGKGLVCVPLEESVAKRLSLPLMVDDNTCPHGTKFTISVDAKQGTSTGISASDRSKTISLLASKNSKSGEFISPGHVFPLIAHPGGVLHRAGHTESSIELCRLAGLTPAAVICEIIGADGEMLRGMGLVNFANKHSLKIFKINDLVEYKKNLLLTKSISKSVLKTNPVRNTSFESSRS